MITKTKVNRQNQQTLPSGQETKLTQTRVRHHVQRSAIMFESCSKTPVQLHNLKWLGRLLIEPPWDTLHRIQLLPFNLKNRSFTNRFALRSEADRSAVSRDGC